VSELSIILNQIARTREEKKRKERKKKLLSLMDLNHRKDRAQTVKSAIHIHAKYM
jgi:hypothetical protein